MKQTGAAIRQMSVDDLSERISIVYFETTRNARGDIVSNTEITRCTVWAKVLPLAGKISDTAPARENAVTYRITIRHREDILPNDEIIWRGRRLKILTPPINLESRKIWLQFDCKEVIQDGWTKNT